MSLLWDKTTLPLGSFVNYFIVDSVLSPTHFSTLGTVCTSPYLSLTYHIFLIPCLVQVSVLVQLCVGGYWPCVGYFRGRLLLHEQRNTVILITK